MRKIWNFGDFSYFQRIFFASKGRGFLRKASKIKYQRRWLIVTYYFFIFHLFKVEVIGGADKYMAVCRGCFFAPVIEPASPRIPLKNLVNDKENTTETEEIPHKRALFDSTAEKAIENSV